MLLLSRWWSQLQAKASNPDSAPLLQDDSPAVHTSQYSFVSSSQHHSRHHPPSFPNDAQGEEGLIEQHGSEGYQGSDSSKASSCNRGVLPGLFQRRRPLPAPLMSLHGQPHAAPNDALDANAAELVTLPSLAAKCSVEVVPCMSAIAFQECMLSLVSVMLLGNYTQVNKGDCAHNSTSDLVAHARPKMCSHISAWPPQSV